MLLSLAVTNERKLALLLLVIASVRQNHAATAQDAQALTPDEWAQKFNCDTKSNETTTLVVLPFKNIWSNLMDERCNKDPQSWRFEYIDEIMPAFTRRVRETTIDERLANIGHAINMANMFDSSHTYFRSGDGLQDARNMALVSGTQVNETTCARDLELMSRLFDDFKKKLAQLRDTAAGNETNQIEDRFVRLARVLDSFGRYKSGALEGKTRLVGDYDECEGSQLLDESSARLVPMRYCWANLKSDRYLNSQLKKRKRFAHETSLGLLNAGVCLPRSCHSRNLHKRELTQLVQKFVDSQMRLPGSIYVHQTYELESVFCLVDRDSEYAKIPQSGKTYLLFIAGWIMLCVSLTLLNIYAGSEDEPLKAAKPATLFKRISKHLDLVQSWHEFTSDKRKVSLDQVVNLDALNPVKFGASMLCIGFHSFFMLSSIATSEVSIGALIDSTAMNQGTVMTNVVIDTFFVMSALLGTYISLTKLDQHHERQAERCQMIVRESSMRSVVGTLREMLMLAIGRYSRIVPLYMLMFWFRRDVLTFLGWGPFWDFGLNKETMNGGCLQEPWYAPLSWYATFTWPTKQCFMTAWSIGLDIIFGCLLLPPVILLSRKRPRWAMHGLVALMIASILAYIEAFTTVEPAGVRWEMFEQRISGMSALFTSFNYLYAWPIYRLPSFVVGMLAGYHLYAYNVRRLSETDETSTKPSWPAWFTGTATRMAIVYILLHGLVSALVYEIKLNIAPYHRLLGLYVFTADRAVWSLANAIIFLRMVTDWRLSPTMVWFSSQMWRSLAKLCYPIMFVHWIIIVAFVGSVSDQPSLTTWNILNLFSTLTLATLPASMLVHVIFENPFDKLIRREILRL